MRRPLLLALGLLASLAGCAVGPDYQKPAPAAPPAFGEDGPWKMAVPKDDLPKDGWWKIFGDPTLNRLEDEATTGNLTAQAALARFDEACAIARVSRAAFVPALAVNGTAARERFSGNREVPPGAGHGTYTTNTADLPLDLSYQIDVFGRVRRGYESARDLAQAQEADYQNVRLGLQAEVAQDYFALRALQAERDLLTRTVDLRRQDLDLVSKRRRGGASDDLDVDQDEAELASVESQALAVDQNVAQIRHALAVLLGEMPEDLAFTSSPLSGEPPAVPAGLPSELLGAPPRRPAAAGAGPWPRPMRSSAWPSASFSPSIGLTGGAGFNSTAFNSLLQSTSREWSIGPFVSPAGLLQGAPTWPITAGRSAAYREQMANYRQQVLVVFQDVDDGLSDLRYLAAQAEALGRAADASRRAADLSNLRYRQGVTDYFEVIDAERTALDNELPVRPSCGASGSWPASGWSRRWAADGERTNKRQPRARVRVFLIEFIYRNLWPDLAF